MEEPLAALGPACTPCAPGLWPAGPWESAPWPGALAYAAPGGGGHPAQQHQVADELYPDSYAPSLPLSGFDDDLAMATLATMTTYQEYHIQSDSLFPSDSYAEPPPDYPLYNWTLPYGPAVQAVQASQLAPSPTAPASLPARLQGHRGRPGEPVHVQFKGNREVRRLGASGGPPEQAPPAQAPPPWSLDEFLDDDVVEVEVRSSQPGESSGSERVVFDSIEEALLTIEAQDLADTRQQADAVRPPPVPSERRVVRPAAMRSRDFDRGAERGLVGLGDGTQEDVVKAAKSLFSKRTRTLYHWLYPDTSKTKLKATVSAAWDTLAETEKQFYLSQVLGRFGLQASSLMINPQLGGIKDLPVSLVSHNTTTPWTSPATASTVVTKGPTQTERPGMGGARATAAASRASPKAAPTSNRAPRPAPRPSPAASEAQQAVDGLFASCSDSDTWTSYSMSSRASSGSNKRLALGDEVPTPKRPRNSRVELEAELEGDEELSSALETFRLLANDQSEDADFWPQPADIFPQVV
ncbi:uncharacterized protein LOC113217394 [Frankliniella occidentalis]|uniref:Uncharacterized protein LOC113217394 n=1 Tax=Frankliniella occidentalis TaxID=133901 RepID=A0A6J1THU4_FRAOC|nr:uncharacterized protein LOC113217394 [Frankliniella occidentalis]